MAFEKMDQLLGFADLTLKNSLKHNRILKILNPDSFNNVSHSFPHFMKACRKDTSNSSYYPELFVKNQKYCMNKVYRLSINI